MDKTSNLIPITSEELVRYGAEISGGVVYIIRLDRKRYIDIHDKFVEWIFFLREEPTTKREDVALFTGRKVEYIHEITDLYYCLTGKKIRKKRAK